MLKWKFELDLNKKNKPTYLIEMKKWLDFIKNPKNNYVHLKTEYKQYESKLQKYETFLESNKELIEKEENKASAKKERDKLVLISKIHLMQINRKLLPKEKSLHLIQKSIQLTLRK